MRRSLEASERAWVLPIGESVRLDPFHHASHSAGGLFCFGRAVLTIKNFGKGPAFDVSAITDISYRGPKFEPNNAWGFASNILAPQETKETGIAICVFGRGEAKALNHDGIWFLHVVSYRDQFNIKRQTQISLMAFRRHGSLSVSNSGWANRAY